MRLRIFFVILIVFLNSLPQAIQESRGIEANDRDWRGCSVFTLAKGEQVFFGGNDDYINYDSYYWVDPGDGTQYGVIWIGQPDNVQQGVNEMGLAYDSNGLPRVDVNPHNERKPVSGSYTSYPIHIMHECATVEEVIAWVDSHQWHSFMHDQMQFADATGDAVIISPGKDGEVVFTRKDPGDGFIVSTNFNVANPANGYGYPCWRYETASELLNGLVKKEGEVSVGEVASVLDAIHQQGVSSWTKESLLADLPNGIVYLYFFWQYDKPLVLNVAEELANPRQAGALSELFPEDVRKEANRRYQAIQQQGWRCQLISIIWIVLVAICLIMYFMLPAKCRKSSRLWIPALIILGPMAFVALLATGAEKRMKYWRLALLESIGDLMPTAFAYLLFLCQLLLFPGTQSSWPLQLVMIVVFPFLVGWLFFNGLLLSSKFNGKTGVLLKQRIPHVWIAANMGFAGISLLGMPMVRQSIQYCPVFPPSVMTVIILWVIVGVGALAGAIFLFAFEYWSVLRGSRGWSAITTKEVSLVCGPWSKLWWWIIISYVILFAALATGIQ